MNLLPEEKTNELQRLQMRTNEYEKHKEWEVWLNLFACLDLQTMFKLRDTDCPTSVMRHREQKKGLENQILQPGLSSSMQYVVMFSFINPWIHASNLNNSRTLGSAVEMK